MAAKACRMVRSAVVVASRMAEGSYHQENCTPKPFERVGTTVGLSLFVNSSIGGMMSWKTLERRRILNQVAWGVWEEG